MAKARECEDCGEEVPKGERRFKCKRCGLLVCSWCEGHVHALERAKDAAAKTAARRDDKVVVNAARRRQ